MRGRNLRGLTFAGNLSLASERPVLWKMISVGLICCLLFGFALGLSGCGKNEADTPKRTTPKLKVDGDVLALFTLNPFQPAAIDAAPDDDGFTGVPVTELIDKNDISGTPKEVYFFSSDGFVSSVNYKDAGDVYVIFNDDYGWCVTAPKHPVSTGAKSLSKIVIVSENSAFGLRVVGQDGDSTMISYGHILTSSVQTALHLEGSAEKETGGQVYVSKVYTVESSTSLKGLYEPYEREPCVVITADGGKYLTDGTGMFVIKDHTISYVEKNGDRYEGVLEIRLR
jgi:hypothetical protein